MRTFSLTIFLFPFTFVIRHYMADKTSKDEDSVYKKVTSQVADYLFSLVVPVAILTYVAPQKSFNYIIDSAYSKVSVVTDINTEVIWNTTADLLNKTAPMLWMEGEVVGRIIEQSDEFLVSVYQSHWIEILKFYWQYTAAVLAVLLIIVLVFPWQKLADWVAGSIWRTIILFMGVMPLDDGLTTLSDHETGNYEIFITVGAVAFTLLINYLAWWSVWWMLRQLGTQGISLAAMAGAKVWRAAIEGVRGKKQEVLVDGKKNV